MSEFEIFYTERLILKSTSEEDAAFIIELFNTPKWLTYIGDRNVHTIESAKDYIKRKMLPQYKKLGYGNYTLIKKSDQKKIGTCGLYDRQGLSGVDIGFAFLPEYEQKGYAYEAAMKMISMGFNEFKLNEINAITTEENYSSRKLLKKLGLKLMGTTSIENEDDELLLYSLCKKTPNISLLLS